MTGAPSGLPLLIDRLASALGREHVDASQPPHIRCAPGSAAEVAEVLTCAAVGQVAVSCHGDADALLHLDLSRLTGLGEAISETSLLCEVRAGTSLQALEQLLNERRLTLGPLPLRSQGRLLGAALAAPRPSEASLLMGRLRDRVLRLSAVLPQPASPAQEALLPVALSPRRATGPDIKQLLIGSEGRVGVITAAALQVAARPAEPQVRGWLFDHVPAATGVLHEALLLHGGHGLADAQLHRQGAQVALVLRSDALAELATAVLTRLAAQAEAAGGRELADAAALLAVVTPEHEQALPRLSARALAERFAAAGEGAVLCGVHAHGAALCTQTAAPAAAGAELLRRLRQRQEINSELLR